MTGKVPVLEYNGTILSQHLPILRYLSRELNSYDGQTSMERYLVDAVSDIYIDWRVKHKPSYVSSMLMQPSSSSGLLISRIPQTTIRTRLFQITIIPYPSTIMNEGVHTF